MNIFVRVDSSISIGTGHVMRCLTLAGELRQKDANISFICRREGGHLIDLIEQKGYKVYQLPGAINLRVDKELTQEILGAQPELVDWLIVDHYDLDIEWENSQRKYVGKIMVIDDLANRQHDCDILLDQNYSPDESRYDGLIPDNSVCLLGIKYALLRPQFRRIRENLRIRNGEVKRIIVFMGGSDPYNQTSKVIRAIEMLERDDIKTDVVIGSSNTYRREIEKQVLTNPNITCHFNVENMAKMMADADLSIGAGGSSIWERCSAGLLSIIITVADNQVGVARELFRKGYIIYSGWYSNVTEQNLLEDLKFILRHPEIVLESSLRVAKLVDGQGAKRVSNYLSNNIESIRLRTVHPEDCRNIFEWRNHIDTRKHCFDSTPLVWDEHEQWFSTLLSSSNNMILLIGEDKNGPVGVLRYDFRNNEACVSIYLVPGFLGMGIGNQMLKLGTKWIRENHPEVKNIIAEIKHQNIVSENTFKKAGFKKTSSTYILECNRETCEQPDKDRK